jgi:hypothetical protein
VKKESIWCLTTIVSHNDDKFVFELFKIGILDVIVDNFSIKTEIILLGCLLELLKNILCAGQEFDENPFVRILIEQGFLDKLNEVKEHKNTSIFEMSTNIYEQFFEKYDDELN